MDAIAKWLTRAGWAFAWTGIGVHIADAPPSVTLPPYEVAVSLWILAWAVQLHATLAPIEPPHDLPPPHAADELRRNSSE